jgi:hypothetical protein
MAIADDDLSTRASESLDIADQIQALKAQIAEQHQRIVELEAQRPSHVIRLHEPTEQPSRRDLLRRAGQVGVAAAGAVGGMALLSPAVAATQGSAILAGTTNDETATTVLKSAIGAIVSPTLEATTAGSFVTAAIALRATAAVDTDLAFEANGDPASTLSAATAIYAHTTDGAGVLARSTNGFAVNAQASGAGGIAVVAFAGGRAPVSITPAAAAGPPTTNAHYLGDIWTDSGGQLWVCVTSGTPGVFAPLQTGGANVSHFVRVTKAQYFLNNSDGATWADIDSTGLSLTLTPVFNAQAVMSVSVDLWTAKAGLNQDVGIYVEGGAYGATGAGKIVAWKESGGFAGTYSPNAAYVETTQPLVAGTAYTLKVRWKTNKPASGGIIFAGAGGAGNYSPTRLAVNLIQDGPNPATLTGPMAAFRNDPSKLPAAPKKSAPRTGH